MNPDNTVEYNSLSWVKAQLDDVLSDAQSSLNDYIEDREDENLKQCIEHLQLIYGTLQMVEVYGAAMLTEEMQKTSVALLEGNVERVEDAFDVLMRAMLQLPDYLEKIQAGHKDAPITLMPLINDLRTARKEGLLTESVLFSPELENVTLEASGYDADSIETGKLQGEVKRLRTHYQLGLLDFIRNNKERAGLQRIKAVLSSLEKVSSNAEVRRFWMVAGALVEGLVKEGIDSNLSIKMLLGAVDRQLKLVLDVGEDEFATSYSRELITNVLYYVGLCDVESETIDAVKEAYQLDDLIPKEMSDPSSAIGGLNADLFDTVSVGITEDLNKVKDILELFMQGEEQNLDDLVPVAEQLGRIADTYGMLGMGAVRQSIMDQRDVLDSIIKSEATLSERVVLNIASELLQAESELKDYIAARSGFIDMNRDPENQTVPAAEYRQVVLTVVSEALKNFGIAKEAILSYVSGLSDKESLDVIYQRLEEVRGVSMMLPLGRVETLIVRLQDYIRTALLNNDHRPDDAEQDTVADVVTAIEYFFEALSEGRPGVEQGLNAGDEAAQKLEAVSRSYSSDREAPVSEAPEDEVAVEAVPVSSEVEVIDIDITDEVINEPGALDEISIEETEQVANDAAPVIETAETVPEVDDEAKGVEQYAILADDADEEIVEIFIEEAVEVLGELHTYVPQWKANHDDEEALAVVRRSFHTLKGSGRLLGAELIGEFSWKFENMMNRVIDKKIIVGEQLLQAIDESLAVLPQLIEQLKGNREPIENIIQLMSAADAIADGREPDLIGVSDEASAQSEPAPVVALSVDTIPEDEVISTGDADAEDIDTDITVTDGNFDLEDIAESAAAETQEDGSVEEISIDIEALDDDIADIEIVDLDISSDDDAGTGAGVQEDTIQIDIEESAAENESELLEPSADEIIFDTGVLIEDAVDESAE
ncbi:MAG: Hpt domain-containing protein, partial [Proteobacteria bacterium]|nr:Hpt domain-containing protein [Pseudomonadota bacterium]